VSREQIPTVLALDAVLVFFALAPVPVDLFARLRLGRSDTILAFLEGR
jgi:hypothetical protein